MPWDDDEDWVGEPPEGHYGADRARPAFWASQRPPQVLAGIVLLGLIVLVLVLVLR